MTLQGFLLMLGAFGIVVIMAVNDMLQLSAVMGEYAGIAYGLIGLVGLYLIYRWQNKKMGD